MIKIYWYRKPNGDLLDIGENTAWQVHNEYIGYKHNYKYLGWSDGKFINEVKKSNKAVKNENGVMQAFSKETQDRIYEAVDKEIENANPEPPENKSREEFGKGGVGKVTTPGLAQRMK